MADSTLPGLSAAPSIQGNTQFWIRRNGQTRDERAALTLLQTALSGGGSAAISVAGLSGLLATAQNPVTPTSSSLGGVQSIVAVNHKFINSISTSGVPLLVQPAFGDLSGSAQMNQLGTGTPSSSNYLRGDGSWQPISSGISNPLTAGSLSATAIQIVDTGTGIYQPGTHVLGLSANGVDVIRGQYVSSAVNYLDISPSSTGNNVVIAVSGSDNDIGILLQPKGSGTIKLNSGAMIGAGLGIGIAPEGDTITYQSSGNTLQIYSGVFSFGSGYILGWTSTGDGSSGNPVVAIGPYIKSGTVQTGIVQIQGTSGSLGQLQAACLTGSGSAIGLGNNCPAVTLTAPTTWMKVTTDMGLQGYVAVYV